MRRYMRKLCLALSIAIIFLIPAQSQADETDNVTMNNCTQQNISDPIANITMAFQVYEINSNSTASFGDIKIEHGKQKIYNATIKNNGEVTLNDVIISISAADGIIFKDFGSYDSSGNLELNRIQCGTNLIRNLGALESNKSISIIINAYIKPGVDDRQINAKVFGIKPGGNVTHLKNNAEKATCIFLDNTGKPCDELREGCICQRPIWANAFGSKDLSNKPLIHLSQIQITNKINAIKKANQDWNTDNFDKYTPQIGDQVKFYISITNTDINNSLRNISVIDQLPLGMIYLSSRIIWDQTGSLSSKLNNNAITWRFGELKPNSQIVIENVAAFLDIAPKRFDNRVFAEAILDTEYANVEFRSQEVSSVISI